jgi:NADPH:quinone reductase-like Zn-dependent oxidoreductase
VGSAVERFQPGNDVFGISGDSFAEYTCRPEGRAIAPKPASLTFEQAAAVPLAALTALQGLRDKGGLRAGQKVLVNGASGGVGTFAVQIAKALGAEVTGVTSTKNLELVSSLGADRVLDYTREDFTRSDERYDVLLDNAGGRSWSDVKRVLADRAILVRVGGPKGGRILGAVKHLLVMRVASIGSSQTVALFLARPNRDDLLTLRDLVEEGKLRPAIDRTYELSRVPEALEYLGTKHARAKVVITV